MDTKLLQTIPISARWLVRPALFFALGLHAIALLIPLPSSQVGSQNVVESPASENQDMQVQLSPSLPPSRPVPPTPASQPTPIARATLPTSPPQRQHPIPQPQLPAQPVAKVQRPIVPVPELPAAAAVPPVASAPAPEAAPANAIAVAPPPAPAPAPALINPFADFPYLEGSQAGCFGLETCHQVEGTPFRAAGQTLKEQLKAQGYEVKRRDDLEETGRSVYEVSKNGVTRYLNILSSDLGTSVYALADQPLTLTDLQQANTAQSTLEATLDQFAGVQQTIPPQLTYPELFLQGTAPRPEVDGFRVISATSPNQLHDRLTENLEAAGYSLLDVGQYSGGVMYEVTQGAFTRYLNLVPSQNGTDTVLVVWKELPV